MRYSSTNTNVEYQDPKGPYAVMVNSSPTHSYYPLHRIYVRHVKDLQLGYARQWESQTYLP